ncbi:MAG: hypothetical protein NVSMB55_06650 [Mycobacteriales bacterium]
MPRFRRSALLAAAALTLPLLAGAAAAQSGSSTASRSLQTSYSRAGGVAATTGNPVLVSPGAAQAATGLEDRARVTASDGSGRTVAIDVQWTPRGSAAPLSSVYCGASPTLLIARESTVRVTPLAGTCPDGTVSLPTSGSIRLVFTRPVVQPTIGPADRWAVLVGIQDYAGNTHPTFGGRGDVSAIRTALLSSGWRSDHIRTLVDGQATGAAIIDAMGWLADRSGPTTFSLFHFSGHVCIASRGPCAPGHTYLWSEDNRFIPETTVGAVLGRTQGRAWFDIAGCESGAFDVGLHSGKRLFTGSSQPGETSYEQPDWHESVWAGLVWDRAFLQGDAGPAPGRATIGQMVAYGQTQAPRVTAGQQAGPQHPVAAGGDPTQSLFAPRP